MPLIGGPGYVFEYQAPAALNQAAAVQNTWYPILDTTANVKIYTISVATVDQNETLEVRITIDGQVFGAVGIACTDGQENMVYLITSGVNRTITCGIATNVTIHNPGMISITGHSVLVEARKTTAAGVSQLRGVVSYGVLESI